MTHSNVALESCWTHQQACQCSDGYQCWGQGGSVRPLSVTQQWWPTWHQPSLRLMRLPHSDLLLHQRQDAVIVFSYTFTCVNEKAWRTHWWQQRVLNKENKSEGWMALIGTHTHIQTPTLSYWPPSLVLANEILFLMIFDTGFISFPACVCQRRPLGWWRALDAQLVWRSGPQFLNFVRNKHFEAPGRNNSGV